MASHHGRAKSGARAILGLSFWSSEVFCQYPKGFHKANYNFIYFNLAVVWLDLAVHTTSGTPPSCAPMPGTCRTWNCWDWSTVPVILFWSTAEGWCWRIEHTLLIKKAHEEFISLILEEYMAFISYILQVTKWIYKSQISPFLNTDGQFNPASF